MAAGDPTGDDLCSGTLNGDTLSSSYYAYRNITFTVPVEITADTQYALVLRAPDSEENVYWASKLSGGYAGGRDYLSSDSGETWAAATGGSGDDYGFTTRTADLTIIDQYIFTLDEEYGENTRSARWIAQTFTASQTYTIAVVTIPLKKDAGGSIGTITLSVRAVDGLPSKPVNPAPSDAATNVTLDQETVTWEDGGDAETYDVYYGTTSGDLTKVSSAQAGTSFTIFGIDDGSPFSYLNVRYWRIDATNSYGTTTGDEWVFTTIRFYPPQVTYWYSTGGYYYQLLVQADGSLGDPPPTGTENTDYVVLGSTYAPNFIRTQRKLVAAANNKMWYEAT